ncbi:hypothetical protein EZV76_10125 [Flagellimonas alvinocaridis]|uniref:Alpha/beta hydrolase n=1 Tax=Flagellimonas alvinocaridis TaxID=2530200 RepID=A0A4S8RL19_9FLAO|nr:hypothetical protein [Allomuricauda alvinocaridis]THV59183.1 hypothetical protein EZV76_10125 [Allomuricauda alvinocaridis]
MIHSNPFFFAFAFFISILNLRGQNTDPIQEGSGYFQMEVGNLDDTRKINVYYHRPKNFNPDSKVILVIPGAGRNADTYRDAWIVNSEKYNVLVLSPMYPKSEYGFEDYHLGGIIQNLNISECISWVEGTNEAILYEDKLVYHVNPKKRKWLFNDFDAIFDFAITATQSNQTSYDIFGHSAGGQILHRFALFHPFSKADRILASNSGFYTLPDFGSPLPFGLKNSSLTVDDLKASFGKKLILFIGEMDNENETGGTLLRSKSADQQGYHRLERAQYSYLLSQNNSKKLGAMFNWKIKIVPKIGHDYRKMSQAAGSYLYE